MRVRMEPRLRTVGRSYSSPTEVRSRSGPAAPCGRGTGGLVTALIGLASHRDVTWIASAMTDEDGAVAEEHGGRPFPVEAPGGGIYNVKLVVSDPDAYDRFYNITANPMLWFIQHYLWDQSNAPDIRRNETEAFEFGYNAVNEDLARAVLEEIDGIEHPVVMAHDYHLYTLPGLSGGHGRRLPHHFIHIPWSQPDSWRVLPKVMREELYRGILSNDIVGFHTSSYRRNFLHCCEDLLGLEVDHQSRDRSHRDRDVWVRVTRSRSTPTPCEVARRPRTRIRTGAAAPPPRQRILRVDRADLLRTCCAGLRRSTYSWSSIRSSENG